MSDVTPITKNLQNVNRAAKDETLKMFTHAVHSKKINLKPQELQLALQVISAAIDSSFGNSEKVIKKITQKVIDDAYAKGLAARSGKDIEKKTAQSSRLPKKTNVTR